MKGMKALEYRIWARSFTKVRTVNDYDKLDKIRNLMRSIRSIRLDKDFYRNNLLFTIYKP
jgi:hypothetical protein